MQTTLDPERQKQAKQYARIKRRLWLVDTSLSAVYFLAWIFFGWSISLRDWIASFAADDWLLIAIFIIIFGGLFSLITLPLSYYSGFVLPHRFGQSNQSLKDWVIDRSKDLPSVRRWLCSCWSCSISPCASRVTVVAVGGRRNAGLHRSAFQSCAHSHHAALQ
jgi:hypothetical protein